MYGNVDIAKQKATLTASREGELRGWRLCEVWNGITGKKRKLFALYPLVHLDFESCECVTLF